MSEWRASLFLCMCIRVRVCVCLLGACINFLFLNNNGIMHLACESNTLLLAHLSIGVKSNGLTGFSAQGPIRLISK